MSMTRADANAALRNAAALMPTADQWAAGAMARDATGRPSCSTNAASVAWSLVGALNRVTQTMRNRHPTATVPELLRVLGVGDDASARVYNDAHGHAGVMLVLNRGIAATEGA